MNQLNTKKALLSAALLTFSCLAHGQSCFNSAVNYGVGVNPYSVVLADFNNDGNTDMATANYSSNNATIRLGTGGGNFGAATNIALGAQPFFINKGDFNADGNMDLAVAIEGPDHLSVLLGNGNGTFASAVNYAVGLNPASVAVADFNGDGKLDLASGNNGSNNISVLFGSATGTFAAAVNYPAGSAPRGVISKDFNNDGKQDLAVANIASNNVSVLLGSASGTFASAVNYAVGANPNYMASADFNSDGHQDLSVGNLGSNNVSILFGSPTGTFSAPSNIAVGSSPYSVSADDFNADGKMDLALPISSGAVVSILMGNGLGGFAAASNYGTGVAPRGITTGDIDGNGSKDIAVTNDGSSNVSVLLNCNIIGAALNFDGVNDDVALPLLNYSGTNKITIEAWVRPNNITSNMYYEISRQQGGNPDWLLSFQDNGTILSFGLNTTAGYSELDVPIVAANYTNGWHHVAAVYNGTNQVLYVDGVQIGSQAKTGNILFLGTTHRLGSVTNTEWFNGNMDEVRYWNVARTQCEIKTFKNCEIPTTAAGLIGNYHFNQGIAVGSNSGVTSLTDFSGSAFTGTLNSFALTGAISNWVSPGGVVSGSIIPAALNPTVGSTVTSSVICNGQSTTLNGTGANTYVWTGGVTNGIAFSPTTTLNYTVTGTATLTGCTNTAVNTVTVNANPTITVNGGSICNGNSFTIVPSGAASYTIQGGFAIVSPTVSTNYNVVGTSTAGCPNVIPALSIVTVNALPTVSVNSGSICSGNSFTMIPSGASTYTIQGGNAVVSPLSLTSYTVRGTSLAGCLSANTATSNVTVNTTPTVAVNSGSICTGNSFTIVPSGANSYTISGGTSVVSPLTNMLYNVTGTSAQGCVSSNTAVSNVAVNITPTVSVNSGTICSGNFFTITPSGASTYTISGGANIVSPLTNTVYNVTGTSAQGCVSSNTAVSNVAVNITPTVSVNSGTICSGNFFTITPSGASTYTISGGANIVSPLTNTVYNVTGTSAQGCVSSNTAVSNVVVNITPTVIVNSGTICSGNSFTIVPSGASTYTISGGASVVSPLTNTLYNITGTSAQGCVSSNTAVSNVVVNITPTVSVNSGTICSGKSFTIIPSGASTYTISGGANIVSPLTSTLYNVTGTSAEGCVSSNTVVSNVTVNALPNVNSTASNATICIGETSTLSASGASTYVWNATSTLVTLVVSPTITTSYTVSGTDNNGCVNTSTITQNVSACTGIDKVAEALEATISIYPNPNNGEFTILSSSDSRLSIINELGQIVKTVSLNANNEHKVLINEMANGIYFVVGQSNNQVIKQKMIVNK